MKDKAAVSLGKRGGQKTASLYGSEHFSNASKARKSFKGGRPRISNCHACDGDAGYVTHTCGRAEEH